MDEKEKIFGSPSDYPFFSHEQKIKRVKKVTDGKRLSKGPSRRMNGFQKQMKRTKYKISRRIVGGL